MCNNHGEDDDVALSCLSQQFIIDNTNPSISIRNSQYRLMSDITINSIATVGGFFFSLIREMFTSIQLHSEFMLTRFRPYPAFIFFFLKKKCNELNQIVGAISPRRPLTPSALVNPPAKELRCQTFSIKHAPTRWPYHLDIEIYSRCKPTYAVSFFACSGGWSGLMLRNLVIAVLLHFNGTRSYVYQSRNCIKTVN